MTPRLLELAVDVGAAYRLTRLVTRDALTAGLRERLTERLATDPDLPHLHHRYGPDVAAMGGPLPYLLHCPWCMSLWVAAGVAVARRVAPLPWAHAAPVLASSAIIGWLAERE